MTFHKHAVARLALLLTLLFAFVISLPTEARHQRKRPRSAKQLTKKKAAAIGRHSSRKGSAVGHATRKAKAHRRGRRGRRVTNYVPHAARYLAAAQRLKLGVGDVQTGKASWYGARYHGRTTSSGERFDKDALTAAHLSLPFGTRVRVRNLTNDSSVVVRITDRGPFGRGRIVDVSEGAARLLGIYSAGIAQVAMEILPEALPEPCFDAEDLPTLTPIALEQNPDTYYFLQAGAFQELAAAEAAVQALLVEQPGLRVVISDETVDGQTIHRVLAGRFTDRIEAVLVRTRLQADGHKADVRTMILAEG